MAVKLRDVADSAGVSLATASRALRARGTFQVARETRDRVWAAVRELGYEVPATAKESRSELNGETTRCVGLILDNDHDLYAAPFWMRVLAGIEQELVRHRYHLLFSFTVNDLQYEHKRQLVNRKHVDGLIFAGGTRPFENDIGADRSVTIDFGDGVWVDGDLRYDYIGMEKRRAMYQVADHLVGLGRRRFAYLGPAVTRDERPEAFYQRLASHGLTASPENCPITPWTTDGAYPIALDLLTQRHTEIDAAVCACDPIAVGVIRAAKELGLRLPEDLAIVGFNDDPLAQDLDPALTTVTAPKDLIGVLAARRLIERIHAPDLQPIIQLVPTKLVVRRSCGAALGLLTGTS